MLKVYENTKTSLEAEFENLPCDQILIEGLVLPVQIGVFDFEHGQTQSVRFDLVVDIDPLAAEASHDTNNIVRYDHIVADIKTIINEGHIDLVETLAERIAATCLLYERARQVCVTVGKLDAIDEAQSVGIRVTRRK